MISRREVLTYLYRPHRSSRRKQRIEELVLDASIDGINHVKTITRSVSWTVKKIDSHIAA